MGALRQDFNGGVGNPSIRPRAIVATLIFMSTAQGGRPFLADKCDWPTKSKIDAPLVFGAVVFGVGWGLAGLCPGPQRRISRPYRHRCWSS